MIKLYLNLLRLKIILCVFVSRRNMEFKIRTRWVLPWFSKPPILRKSNRCVSQTHNPAFGVGFYLHKCWTPSRSDPVICT